MDRTKVVPFLVVLCSSTFLQCWAYNRTQMLMWSQMPLLPLPISSILKIEGDPNSWMWDPTPPVTTVDRSNHEWGSAIKALGFSYHRNLLVWSETMGHRIQMMSLDRGQHQVDLLTGTSGEVKGMAVDWINDNVYWTDGLYNWLSMAPLRQPGKASSSSSSSFSSKRIFRIVAQEGLDNPYGVAVHPGKNWLLLSDGGVRPRIERMDLMGKNREALVDSNILAPRGLVIDMDNLRLFWVDDFKGTIESIHLRGADRRRTVLFQKEGFTFYDIAYCQDYLFLTDVRHIDLKILDVNKALRRTVSKTEGEKGEDEKKEKKEKEDKHGQEDNDEKVDYMGSFALGNRPYGIVMFDQNQQPGVLGQCEKAGCEHMCVERARGISECLCGEGYDLMDDGSHCVEQKRFPYPSHVYSLGEALCMYPAHVADMSMDNVSLTSQCGTLSDNYGYLALGFDARSNVLFFSGNYTRAIFAMTMEVGAKPKVIVSGTGMVEGLAVDWVTSSLFWTDSSRGQILVSRTDGSFQKVLLQDNLYHPLGIAVHPRRGKIYWTDVGSPPEVKPKIESANMDGSERRVLVGAKNLGQPNHVFIDYHTDRLYWADSVRSQVVSYDLNADQWSVFFTMPSVNFYGLSLYKNYLLWTDSQDMNGIHMARVDAKQKVRGIIHPDYGQAADLVTVDGSLQPDMASPCQNGQTLCDQLCLPRGADNHTCHCGLGFTLRGGMVCSYGNYSKDNFLLVTDAYQRNVYQVDVSSGVIKAVTRGERHQPMAIGFLPGLPGNLYWSDNVAHVIRRKELGLGWTSTFLDLPEDSKVEGIAIDPVNQLLFYTDTDRDVIGVADLGLPGSPRHAVIIRKGLTNPRAIVALAATRRSRLGKIYWTDWGERATISEASMLGNHRKVLVEVKHTAWLNGLALDRQGQALYWTDGYSNNVGVYYLTSGQSAIVLTTPAAHFYGLYLMGDSLYLTDWRRRFLLRMPKKGGKGPLTQFGEGKFNKLYGVTGYNSSEYPKEAGKGLCALQTRCAPWSICLPLTARSFKCVCVFGYVRLGYRCHQNKRHNRANSTSDHSDSMARRGKFSAKGSTSVGVVVIAVTGVVIFCIAAGLGVFCFYRRHRSYEIPHARLGLDQPPERRGHEPPPVAFSPPVSSGPAPNRMTSALAHLKVFYARRPGAEQVRIEEGLDNPSYNEAAMAMMAPAPRQASASSEDNQPTL